MSATINDAKPVTQIKLHIKKGSAVHSHNLYSPASSYIQGVNVAPKHLYVAFHEGNKYLQAMVPLTDNFSHPQISPLRVSINGKTYGAIKKIIQVTMGFSSDLKASNPVNGNKNLYSYTQKYAIPTNIKRIVCWFAWINQDVTKYYVYSGTKLEVSLTMIWDINAKKYTSLSFTVTDNGKNIGTVSGTPAGQNYSYLQVFY